jgi:hypothetical protein
VLDFCNRTFKKASHVKTEVIHHASAKVVHPQWMEHFDVAEVIDPQEAEQSYITRSVSLGFSLKYESRLSAAGVEADKHNPKVAGKE